MNRVTLYALWAALTLVAQAAERRRGSEATPAATGAPAAAGTSAPAGSLEAFALVTERNIFNPNRTARTRAAPEEKPVRTEEVALVGVVGFGAATAAVFHSTDPRLKGEAAAGGSLGDFTIVAVSPSAVELRAGERTFTLAVAQRLTRVEGGDWTASAAPVPEPRSRAEAAPVEIPANASEVLKRLMKQREKQLKE
ncbi:MAG: hypothetical protein FJ397_01925 [Verrucomicrobia bacterium]|nr:hypothetical protein [Verrucomicrobiota bacterium]